MSKFCWVPKVVLQAKGVAQWWSTWLECTKPKAKAWYEEERKGVGEGEEWRKERRKGSE